MAGPAWLSAVVAATMLVVAANCATRLVAARLWGRGIDPVADVNHLLMGVAMAGMLVPRLGVLPATAWEAVFAAGCAWYGWQAIRSRRSRRSRRARRARPAEGRVSAGGWAGGWRCSPPVPHLVGNAAMVYMLAAARMAAPGGIGSRAETGAMPGMAASAPARYPVLALVFALFLVGYVAWLGDRLTSMTPALAVPPAGGGAPGPALAPRTSACCQIAMGLAMGYMLVTML